MIGSGDCVGARMAVIILGVAAGRLDRGGERGSEANRILPL